MNLRLRAALVDFAGNSTTASALCANPAAFDRLLFSRMQCHTWVRVCMNLLLKSKLVLGEASAMSLFSHSRKHTMRASRPHSAISIRNSTSDDALEILACLHSAFAPYRGSYSPAAYLDTVLTPETLQDRFARMQVFVAQTSSGQIVGTIACQAIKHGEGHLRGMAVLPDCQGAGIAAELLAHAEAELRRQNCTRITLDTTAPLERAMRFYEKFGYRRSGKISDFFGMPLFEYHKILQSD